MFNLYKNGQLIQEVITDNNGECLLELSHGDYKLVQKKGKKGYSFVEDYEFTVNHDSINVIELYNEAIIIDVPDTMVLGTMYDFLKINLRRFRVIKMY